MTSTVSLAQLDNEEARLINEQRTLNENCQVLRRLMDQHEKRLAQIKSRRKAIQTLRGLGGNK
jgi:hypothetical protein